MPKSDRLRIVLGNSNLARYPTGGGHWTVFLQYLLGLADLGHDVFLLETLQSSDDVERDELFITTFFKHLQAYGLEDRCSLLLFDRKAESLGLHDSRAFGRSHAEIANIAADADLLWNMCGALKAPLLALFKRKVFVDLDPGHLHVSALTYDMGVHDHDAFLSVGSNMQAADCEVPTLGVRWHPFTPFVYLKMWDARTEPNLRSPFTSVTHWTWEELWLGDRVLSCSKRTAYLRYLQLPSRTGRAFELAANIHAQDETGDRELLLSNGWNLVDPYAVAGSPADYREYIRNSRAEIACPKPIFRELKTGWFSDRSACYLASGRPVAAEDTGFSKHFPTGRGLLKFTDIDEAVEAIREIDRDYVEHSRAARRFAEEYLDSRKCLDSMLRACQ